MPTDFIMMFDLVGMPSGYNFVIDSFIVTLDK